MKLSKLSLLVASGLFAFSIFPGCSAKEKNVFNPLPTPSGITGEIRLRSGEKGDISNTRIAVYDSFEDLERENYFKETALTASFGSKFVLEPLNSGTYYLELWKDLNANDERDAGTDLWGFYGGDNVFTTDSTEAVAIQVLRGRMTDVNLKVTMP